MAYCSRAPWKLGAPAPHERIPDSRPDLQIMVLHKLSLRWRCSPNKLVRVYQARQGETHPVRSIATCNPPERPRVVRVTIFNGGEQWHARSWPVPWPVHACRAFTIPCPVQVRSGPDTTGQDQAAKCGARATACGREIGALGRCRRRPPGPNNTCAADHPVLYAATFHFATPARPSWACGPRPSQTPLQPAEDFTVRDGENLASRKSQHHHPTAPHATVVGRA